MYKKHVTLIFSIKFTAGAEYFDITQTVFDGENQHKICYHYHGKLGQKIMILSDNVLGKIIKYEKSNF